MGGYAYGHDEVVTHASEELLTMRELCVPQHIEEPGYSPSPTESYMLYEYEGRDWDSGRWSQKEFPRAILIVPRKQRDYGAFSRRFHA